MDVAPRYLGAGSFLAARDPRVLVLVPLVAVVAAVQVDDVRLMAVVFALAAAYYLAAAIPLREVRLNWAVVGFFIVVMSTVNGLVVGATSAPGGDGGARSLVAALVSPHALSYAATLVLRLLSLVLVGFPLAYAVRPGDLSVAFARLGVPARFAWAVDLTFRILPTLAADLTATREAQRLRGFAPRASRNPVRRLRDLRPLVAPLTVNALVDAEEIADALDLRGFGQPGRTWLRELHFDALDGAVLGVFVALAVGATAASVAGVQPPTWTW